MLILAIKLKPGVDAHRLESFLKKWVPHLQESTRIGSLTSMKLFSSSHTGSRLDEFVLTIAGFVTEPSLTELQELCSVVYSFECEVADEWPKASPKH